MTGRALPFATLLFARTATNAIVVLGPVILARMLSVEDFGVYREYMLYVTILLVVSGISVYESLLYLVPIQTTNESNLIRRVNGFVAVSSAICCCTLWVASALGIVGTIIPFVSLLVLYVLVSANLDHWEFLWLAQGKAKAASIYISLRAAGKTLTATLTAIISAEVHHILIALIAFEGIRFVGSALAFSRAGKPNWDSAVTLRAQLAYSMPIYFINAVVMASRLASSLFVSINFSPVYFALYVVVTFFETVIVIARNTLCTILFPDIARRFVNSFGDGLLLWKRYFSMTCLFGFPAIGVLWIASGFLLTTVFGKPYAAGADLLKIFTIFLFRECFDFSALLKALGKSAHVLRACALGLIANIVLMYVLHRDFGINGVMVAFVVAACFEAFILAITIARATKTPITSIIPGRELAKLAAAAVLPAIVTVSVTGGIADATLRYLCSIGLYVAAYVALIALSRPESFVYVRDTLFRLWVERPGA